MITIINPSRLTRKPFFYELVQYLQQHEDVILRQIKQVFPDEQVDKHLEEFIQAGLIERNNKRYRLTLPLLESLEDLELDQEVFVETDSALFQDLQVLTFTTRLTNSTNDVVLVEETDFAREKLTLSNYFYKVRHQYPLSEKQEKLYTILGDVNPEYALKYMTSFLLKFVRKDEVMQKRKDIFVDSLVTLGYIQQNEAGKYELLAELDRENLIFNL